MTASSSERLSKLADFPTATDLTSQLQAQLKLISSPLENVIVTQLDKSTVWAYGFRFGKYEQKFTASRTPSGAVKKGSIRFYD